MITSIRSRGWTGKVLVGMMVLQRQGRFYTARCDRMSRCSSRRCSWRTLRAWCQPCRTCGVYLDVSCSLKKRYQGCWSQMLSLLWWYVWYLWKNVRICLICQGSSVIYSRQGALWAQICEICCSLCPRWWCRVWGWLIDCLIVWLFIVHHLLDWTTKRSQESNKS